MRSGLGAPDPGLVQVMRSIRQDARSTPAQTEVAPPVSIAFTFDGAGLLPIIGDTVTLPLGKLSARIVGATITADTTAAATIDLRIGNLASWPNVSQMYDLIPTISGASVATIDVSQWNVLTLQPDDILVAILTSATGTFTTVTLTLACRRLKWVAGTSTVTGVGGSPIVSISGALVTQRGGQ